ncbi:CHAT domain-containing protein [Micromonospora sp. NBC_01638]|nr:CHAT domain-containing protein [Micromonospora sp. NBC_01638]
MTDVRRLPNETVGLPAGFLRAGAGCVIGTLWPVTDLPGAPLMQRYQLLLGVPDRAARCPRAAQRWLAGAGDAELAAYFAGEPAPAEAPHDERWLFADSHYWGRVLSGQCRMRAR